MLDKPHQNNHHEFEHYSIIDSTITSHDSSLSSKIVCTGFSKGRSPQSRSSLTISGRDNPSLTVSWRGSAPVGKLCIEAKKLLEIDKKPLLVVQQYFDSKENVFAQSFIK